MPLCPLTRSRVRHQAARFNLVLLTLWSMAIGVSALPEFAGAQSQSQSDLDTPLTAPGGPPGLLSVEPTWRPLPMVVEGKAFLVYELFVTNFQTAPITLESLRADGGPMGIFNYDAHSLKT